MNERLKELRNSLGFSQKEFSQKVQIGQSTLAMFETGDRTMKDIHISQICTAFNANEEWLRYGTGEMFVNPTTFSLDEYAKSNNLKDTEINLIRGFMELDPNIRSALYDMFKKAFVNEPSNDVKSLYEESPKTPEELEKLYPPVNFKENSDVC